MPVVRVFRAAVAVVVLGLVSAGCAGGPPAADPDPLVSCSSLSGSISYTPPAQNAGVGVTIDALPGTGLAGCTDRTGSGITSASISVSALFPAFQCGLSSVGAVVGSGTGRIGWSDGSVSDVSVSVLTRNSGFVVEFTVTGGRWPGARASLSIVVTSSQGNCTPAAPVTSATIASIGPFELHPAVAPLRPPLTGARQVSAGGGHTCAVVDGGYVNCWGSNSDGQLGNILLGPGATTTVPVTVSWLARADQVSAGDRHTCALLGGGAVSCWGSNQYGQLGSSTGSYSNFPLPVAGLGPATQVAAGGTHSCALLVDGSVACWGANGSGQLGDGSNAASAAPVAVSGITNAVQISVGGFHSCAVLLGGTARCWGSGGFGQLGDGTTTSSAVPVPVAGLTGLTEVSAGGDHTCALNGAGSVFCWGFNRFGQLGLGFAGESPIATPGQIPYFSASSISAGGAQTCATVGAGVVTCWGANASGELGDGLTIDSATPVPSFGIRAATEVTAGGSHTCALVMAGQLECWGQNINGQLGNGRTDGSSLPLPVVIDP